MSIVIGLLFIGYTKGIGPPLGIIMPLFLGGMFLWMFFEYIDHWYTNHLQKYFKEADVALGIAHTIHGIHHEYSKVKNNG